VIRVVVIGRDEGFRASVRDAVRALRDVCLAGEAADGVSAAVVCALAEPEFVVMDARLPWIEAGEIVRRVDAARPGTRVIGCIAVPSACLSAAAPREGPAVAAAAPEDLRAALRSGPDGARAP
jgi:DNA-binding NarL/FixJ family response regulator